jgi:hypothetical protein
MRAGNKRPRLEEGYMATEAKTLSALNKIAHAVSVKSVASADPAKLCEIYKRYRPLIVLALALIKRIPVYGVKIAAIIEFLMQIADKVCPAVARAR